MQFITGIRLISECTATCTGTGTNHTLAVPVDTLSNTGTACLRRLLLLSEQHFQILGYHVGPEHQGSNIQVQGRPRDINISKFMTQR